MTVLSRVVPVTCASVRRTGWRLRHAAPAAAAAGNNSHKKNGSSERNTLAAVVAAVGVGVGALYLARDDGEWWPKSAVVAAKSLATTKSGGSSGRQAGRRLTGLPDFTAAEVRKHDGEGRGIWVTFGRYNS